MPKKSKGVAETIQTPEPKEVQDTPKESKPKNEAVLVATKGRFSLYEKAGEFYLQDVMGRKICTCTSQDDGMRQLAGFNR